MAGRARWLALTAELDARTRDYFEIDPVDQAINPQPLPTHLDYVCAWYESGQTGKALAIDLSAALHFEVTFEALMRFLRNQFGSEAADAALDSARARASHAMAEEALTIVDTADGSSSSAVSKASSMARSRQWMAERYNPSRYGQAKGVSVNVSIASLHLDALRSRHQEVTVAPKSSAGNTLTTGVDGTQLLVVAPVSHHED